MDDLRKERYELAAGRIREIRKEENVPEVFREYFWKTAEFLEEMVRLKELLEQGKTEELSLEELRSLNERLYQDILPGKYETSYGNPAYAAKMLGGDFGPLLSFLYAELRGMIVFAYEGRSWDFLVCLELFLQVYSEFDNEEIPKPGTVQQILYWYVNDYCQEMTEERIRSAIDPSLDFAVKKIMGSDLSNPGYLYQFGEYVTGQEEKTAEYLNTFSEEEIQAMARIYTEGFRRGFETAGKDLKKKKTVNIRYRLGFERMVRAAIVQFEAMGLAPVIFRSAVHGVNKRQQHRIGYYGAVPNPQYDYDHRNDAGIFLDEEFVSRRLRAMQGAYEKYRQLADKDAGPAVIEVFGEEPFVPRSCDGAVTLTKRQRKQQMHMYHEAGRIAERYSKSEEESFTIISYPVPEIGERFEEIFRETVKINTLDGRRYQQIQQKLIDTLDQGICVHVTGKKENRTDLWIQFHKLEKPEKETNFENFVSSVEIPVGEVFTSPVLKGTSGILHVKKAYLEGLSFHDLELVFADGKVTEYSCKNFQSQQENQEYIRENILHQHKTLPMGEFALGTNTKAYRMARKYGIEEKLPVLIAEKMGPHFALGDTCYSWSEDAKVYNPDGKEVIARDNEVSILRKKDPAKAYFGCHTDITIPYDELGDVVAVKPDGEEIPLILNGKFVLEGTLELNEELEDIG